MIKYLIAKNLMKNSIALLLERGETNNIGRSWLNRMLPGKRCENNKTKRQSTYCCIISRSHESNTHVGSTGLSCIERGHGE